MLLPHSRLELLGRETAKACSHRRKPMVINDLKQSRVNGDRKKPKVEPVFTGHRKSEQFFEI